MGLLCICLCAQLYGCTGFMVVMSSHGILGKCQQTGCQCEWCSLDDSSFVFVQPTETVGVHRFERTTAHMAV